MPGTCTTCGGARRVKRQVGRTWWQVVLLRPSSVDELCGLCGGIGVVKGTPAEEQAFERKRQQAIEEQGRRAAAEKARRHEEVQRKAAEEKAHRTAATSQKYPSVRHDYLERSFGLTFRGNGWSYDGHVDDSHAAVLGDPEVCLLVLKQFRAQLKFQRICVVAGRPVTLVAEAERPFCMVTSLGGAATAEVVAAVIRTGGELLGEDRGVFLLSLP